MLSIDERFIDGFTERFYHLLTGRIPSPVEIPGLGFFLLPQRPLPHHPDEVPSSPALSALAGAIEADRHSPPLTTRRESLDRALQELEVRELAVRERTEVQVLLVRRKTGPKGSASVRIPSADYVLREGDSLVVAGSEESLARFENLR